jgi:D-sedoheptulose 7-phosphate isomerase
MTLTHKRGAAAIGYLEELKGGLDSIVATDRDGAPVDLSEAFSTAIEMVTTAGLGPGTSKLMFIGNGGSAAMAAHGATDYFKNGEFRATSFTDAALLTCLSNDYGYEYVYEKPIRRLGFAGDLLIAISSSGRSPSILNAVQAASELSIDSDNPLRSSGDLNFHIPSHNYPTVEAVHMAVIDAVLQSSRQTRTREDQ